MPRMMDKIILNDSNFQADAFSLRRAFEVSHLVSEEIIGIGKTVSPVAGDGIVGNDLLKRDAEAHLSEQESICEAIHSAMADAITRQRALNEKRRKWLDTELDSL